MASRRSSRSRGRFFCGLVLAFVLMWGVQAAAAGKKAALGGQAPIVVTAHTLFADNKKKVVVYKKGVVVKKGDLTIYADEVVIRLAGQDKGDKGGRDTSEMFRGSGKVDTIEARGRVRIVQADKTATSDEAVYSSATDKITLKGKPRVWQGDNVLTGSVIVYSVKEDVFQVEDAKTILYQQDEKNAGRTAGPEDGG